MKLFRPVFIFALSAGTISSLLAQSAPAALDLGTIASTGLNYDTADLIATSSTGGTIKWYKFNLADGISNGAGNYLDIDTISSGFDTWLGLFDTSGTVLAFDDDSGPGGIASGIGGGKSLLSYGLTSPTRAVSGQTYSFPNFGGKGQNGSLSAGTYYLAIAGGPTASFANNFTVTSSSTDTTSTSVINFRTNVVPEPASLAVLGLGLTALLRSKKK
jgi:hypothetical protein